MHGMFEENFNILQEHLKNRNFDNPLTLEEEEDSPQSVPQQKQAATVQAGFRPQSQNKAQQNNQLLL